MKDIRSLELDELNKELEAYNVKKFVAKQVYDWIHKKCAGSFDEMTNISKELRNALKENFEIALPTILTLKKSKDGTKKYLFELSDGRTIESVLMKYKYGYSVCISSQVGCRMGCAFCATAIGGLERNLSAGEMLSQVYAIEKEVGERISHVVVMGMGEPLDNYDNLLKFIRMISSEEGLNLSQRAITVSTCGIVPKMAELAKEKLQITLAVSLHATTQEERAKLMPVAKSFNIYELLEACKRYFDITGRRVSFEYSLIKGKNDSIEHAERLADLIKDMKAHINLIPVNPVVETGFSSPDAKAAMRFKNKLEKYGINVTIRREMGQDIDASCGQLRMSYGGKYENKR